MTVKGRRDGSQLKRKYLHPPKGLAVRLRASLFVLAKMMLRVIGILIIIAIVFTYLPAFSMNECSGEDPSTDKRQECGYTFHCPVLDHQATTQLSILSIHGWLRLVTDLLKVEELPERIFHPPKPLSSFEDEG